MARKSNTDSLDLSETNGRLAFAIRTRGPKYVKDNSSLSGGQIERLATGKHGTTLDTAAEIALVTGFELKWIALGEGPQMIDQEIWEHTNTFTKIKQLDEKQNIGFSFNPEMIERKNATPKNCLTWVVESRTYLDDIKAGHTVLIDTSKPLSSGYFVINANGQYILGFVQINLDGSAKFITDKQNPGTDQHLQKEQLESLEVIGQVIWWGA